MNTHNMVGLVLTCVDIHGTIFCVESSSVVEHTHWAAHTLVLPFFIRFFTMVTCLAVLAIRALIAFVICRRSFDANGLGYIYHMNSIRHVGFAERCLFLFIKYYDDTIYAVQKPHFEKQLSAIAP